MARCGQGFGRAARGRTPGENRTAQCHEQGQARNIPRHEQLGLERAQASHGARIADVAQHNALGKRPLATLRRVSVAQWRDIAVRQIVQPGAILQAPLVIDRSRARPTACQQGGPR